MGKGKGDTSELAFSEETERQFQELLTRYPMRQAAIVPTLYLAQEQFGYLSVPAMEYVAERLDVPPSKILSVATFYAMFHTRPVGKYEVNVCTSPPCAVVGCDGVLRHIEERLGIKVGQTTPDKKFTLGRAECLASCGTGPMLECNGKYYENLTVEQVDALLDRWSNG